MVPPWNLAAIPYRLRVEAVASNRLRSSTTWLASYFEENVQEVIGPTLRPNRHAVPWSVYWTASSRSISRWGIPYRYLVQLRLSLGDIIRTMLLASAIPFRKRPKLSGRNNGNGLGLVPTLCGHFIPPHILFKALAMQALSSRI